MESLQIGHSVLDFFAHCAKNVEVLHHVVGSAKLVLHEINRLHVALIVLDGLSGVDIDVVTESLHSRDELVEVLVDSVDEVQFLVVLSLSLTRVGRSHLSLEVVQFVEVDVTTNALGGLVLLVHLEVSKITLEDLRNGIALEGHIAVLADVGLLDGVLEVLGVLLEGLVEVALIDVLHPVNGKLITEAGVHIDSLDDGFIVAVVGPGGLGGIGSGEAVDAAILLEVDEHGARVASLHVVDDLLVHLLLLHGSEGILKSLTIEVSTDGEADEILGTVVEVSEEDGIFGSRSEDLASSGGVSNEDLEVGDGVGIASLVVDDEVLVVVDGIVARMVVEGSREGIADAVGDIVAAEDDDVLGLVSVLDEDVVGVSGIGLMSVVPVADGTGDNDGPLLGGGDGEESEQKSNELHLK